MSAIQYLREKAGVFVAIVIALALLLFIIGDLAGSRGSQSRRFKKYYEIGEIAGEKVYYQDFETRVQNLVEIYKLSGVNVDESSYESIRSTVWSQMIKEKILDRHYKDLGIAVSSDELDELVFGDNPHTIIQQLFTDQTTGMFNKSFLVNFLKQTEVDESINNYWLFFEDEIVNDRTYAKYNNLITKGVYVTSKMAEFSKKVNDPTVDFSFVIKDFSSVPDNSLTLLKSEAEAYYNKHKEEYKQSANRDMEYVVFEVQPSESDFKDAEYWATNLISSFATAEDPEQFINLNSDNRYASSFVTYDNVPAVLKDFVNVATSSDVFGPYLTDNTYSIAKVLEVAYRPDSVHVRHILISSGDSYEAVKATADSLADVIKRKIEPFASVAEKFSEDQGTVQLGGDLGWFEEGVMVPEFSDACFTGKKTDIVVVESAYGFHIIEILDQSKNVKKYRLGIIDRNVNASSSTIQNIYSQASSFAGTYDTYEKFNNGIATLGLDKRVASNVTQDQKTLPGLSDPRSLIRSLFEAKLDRPVLDDNQQAVFEIDDNYVVAFCTNIVEEGYSPMTDVMDDIQYAVLLDKKADVIEKEFFEKYNSGTSLNDFASALGLNVSEAGETSFSSYFVDGAGSDPALIGAVTVAKPNVVSGPIRGLNGVYMVNVNNVSSLDQDLEAVKASLDYSYQVKSYYEAYQALEDKANVVDMRYKFY